MLRSGDVVITRVQFADTPEIKIRPALVLFEEFGNVVIAGITSNIKMKGIPITRDEGAVKDSVIKLNYIFTVSEQMVSRVLFQISKEKRQHVFEELNKKLGGLKA
jgi:mRNA interferase MazF